MTLLTTALAFIVTLGCLIVIHELGHYWVARLCNVKVLRFSVGFGRPIWSSVRGPDRTEWVVSAIPLGGYVKMLDEREGAVDERERERAFNRKSVWRRIAIVAAGPAANFLLAVALYWVLFVHGVPGMKPILGPVPAGTPAAVAGFTTGDTLVAIGGEPVQTWQDARWMLLQKAVQRARVDIEVRTAEGVRTMRGIDLTHLTAADLEGDFLRGVGLTRFQPAVPPVIGDVVRGGVAERAGLRPGDEILAIDARPVKTWEELVTAIRARPGERLTLEIRRDGRLLPALAVTPEAHSEAGQPIGRIGAAPRLDQAALEELMTEVRYGPLESIGRALYRTWDTSVFSLQMLGKMIMGDVSIRNLSGPITIADYAGQSAQMGWIAYLLFLALISISLGIINLLPIPLLDGGHLMYYAVEIVKGSPVSEKTMEVGQQLGMVLLFGLMAFALYNDIHRLISG
jgi:regulator of sigma E protease